eukprot:scaffold12427_cov121-Skeletonema_marinoi.AAC.1
MVARLVESVSPPQKAVAVMEATSPISHKKPALSSEADRFSRFTSVDEEVAGLFTLLMSSIAFASYAAVLNVCGVHTAICTSKRQILNLTLFRAIPTRYLGKVYKP